jgi:hypothetical protein
MGKRYWKEDFHVVSLARGGDHERRVYLSCPLLWLPRWLCDSTVCLRCCASESGRLATSPSTCAAWPFASGWSCLVELLSCCVS